MPAELWASRSGSGHPASGRSITSLGLARWCAGNGWPVHPLAPGRKTPVANCRVCAEPGHTRADCSCLRSGRWCHGFHAATLDDSRIEHCWTGNPALGVGVACGPAGLVVIDIDAHGSEPPHRDRILPGIPIAAAVDLRGLRTGFHSLAVLAALRGEPSPADDHYGGSSTSLSTWRSYRSLKIRPAVLSSAGLLPSHTARSWLMLGGFHMALTRICAGR